MTQLIKPITVEIKKRLWQSFKEKVPRTITLNNKIVELVENYVKE